MTAHGCMCVCMFVCMYVYVFMMTLIIEEGVSRNKKGLVDAWHSEGNVHE